MPAIELKGATKVVDYKVKFKDVFHARWFYEQKMEYVTDNGWSTALPGSKNNEFEHKYLEQWDAKGARFIWYHWRLQKPGPSPYIKWYLDIDAQTVALNNHEIMIDGKKTKLHKGELYLHIHAWIQTDPDQKWANHWFLKHIKKMWEERIYGGEYAVSREQLIKEAYELQDWVKRYFKLKRWMRGGGEEWRPGLAFPSHLKKQE